ncbi:hypothetical protein QU487_06445 [Crenobacter sp. SG2305]|uniref:hypothetical protein n=1 Tax=Crenobacter oryzisoli TaxID=3056844 RepID=UPI0025AB069E|nr:hypothetical protein [Crenobacter sp. SG2305]MDN0082392.1 hypothetical protein [Crenobacter sp. SG2305]
MAIQQAPYDCKPAEQRVTVTMHSYPPLTGLGGERLPAQRDYQCSAEACCMLSGGMRCRVTRLNQA